MQVIELPRGEVSARAIEFSPDGRRLAVTADGRVFVADLVAGTAKTLWDEPDTGRADGGGLGFTPDGQFVLAKHADGPRNTIAVHDGDTGRVVHEFLLPTFNDGFVTAPSPDGRTVLVAIHPEPGGYTASFVRWDPLAGVRGVPFGTHRNVIRQLAVSADGRWLAGTFGDALRVWRLDGPTPPTRAAHRHQFGKDFVMCLAISSDGALAVAGEHGRAFRLITVGTGATQVLGVRPRGVCRDAAFHPSRPLLALSGEGGEVMFFDCAARTEVKRFAWGLGDVTAVAFAPDGLRCAAASPGAVVVWDVDV